MNLNVPLVQKYHTPLPLKQAKLKDLQSYVQGLVPDNIFHLYWAPILNAVPSADNNVDDDEPFANLVDYD